MNVKSRLVRHFLSCITRFVHKVEFVELVPQRFSMLKVWQVSMLMFESVERFSSFPGGDILCQWHFLERKWRICVTFAKECDLGGTYMYRTVQDSCLPRIN